MHFEVVMILFLLVTYLILCKSIDGVETSRRGVTTNYGTEYEPIRIFLDSFQIYEYRPFEEAKYLEDRAVEAIEYLRKLVKVKPVLDNIVIPSEITVCDVVVIHEEYHSEGVSDTDLVVFLASADEESSYCIESGGYNADWCLYDQFDRVLVGVIKVCPQADLPTENYELEYKKEYRMLVWVHEILHILGMDDSHYERYIDRTTGEKYVDPVQTFVERGHEVSKIVTPMALQNARDHFDCETLNGVELEQNKIGHLEFRIYYGSIMTKYCNMKSVLNNITLGLLYDSGWYDINWGYSKINYFGYRAGCDFAMEHCLDAGDPPTLNPSADNTRTWCVEKESGSQFGCGFNRRFRAQCKYAETGVSDIPSYFQYWTVDPTKGVDMYTSKYSDFCNFMYVDYWDDEIEMPGVCGFDDNNYMLETKYGEVTGTQINTFCLESTLLEDGESSSLDLERTKGFCYEVECNWVDEENIVSNVYDDVIAYRESRVPESITIRVYSSDTTSSSGSVQCSSMDGDVGEQKSVVGYQGYIVCPKIEEICSQIVDDEIWSEENNNHGDDDENDDISELNSSTKKSLLSSIIFFP